MYKKLDFFGLLLKYLLAILNFLFFVFGLIISISTAVFKLKSEIIIQKIKNNDSAKTVLNGSVIDAFFIALLVIGAIVTIVSFIGFLGTICMNKYLLYAYEFIVIVLFITQISILIFISVKSSLVEDELKEILNDSVNIINDPSKPKNEKEKYCDTMLYFSKVFECCGFNGPDDINDQNCCFSNTTSGCSDKLITEFKSLGQSFLVTYNGFAIAIEFFIILCVPFLLQKINHLMYYKNKHITYIYPSSRNNHMLGITVNNDPDY